MFFVAAGRGWTKIVLWISGLPRGCCVYVGLEARVDLGFGLSPPPPGSGSENVTTVPIAFTWSAVRGYAVYRRPIPRMRLNPKHVFSCRRRGRIGRGSHGWPHADVLLRMTDFSCM